MPGTYPFFELEIRKEPNSLAIRASGALTIDSARAIDEAIAVMGVEANKQNLFIYLEEIFRFEYLAAAKLARTIRKQARRFKDLKILGAEGNIIGVLKSFGIAQHCCRPSVMACTTKMSDHEPS